MLDTKPGRQRADWALPPGWLSVQDVCDDMGLSGPNYFYNKRRRHPDSVPPITKLPNGRAGIPEADYAAWKETRSLDEVVRMRKRAETLRRQAAELEIRAHAVLAS